MASRGKGLEPDSPEIERHFKEYGIASNKKYQSKIITLAVLVKKSLEVES
jgi:hypothetical protein